MQLLPLRSFPLSPDARLLKNYLYINKLIFRCKEAALQVSPQVWSAVRCARVKGNESRMLTV